MNQNEVAEYNQELMQTAAFYVNAKLNQDYSADLVNNWESLLSINLFRKQPNITKVLQENPQLLEQEAIVRDLWKYYKQLTPSEIALFAFETIQEML